MREATAEEIAFLVGQDIWERAFLTALPQERGRWAGEKAASAEVSRAAEVADAAMREWSARFA